MPRYLVKNNRSIQPVEVAKQVLASPYSSSKGVAGTIWLSQEEYDLSHTQWLLSVKRIIVLEVRGKLHIIPDPPPVEVAPPSPSPAAKRNSFFRAVKSEPPVDTPPVEENPENGVSGYSEEALKSLLVRDLKEIAEGLELSTKGLRKSDLVTSILEAQQ